MSYLDTAETATGESPARDLGPLAWVLDEVRKSLESANKAIRRYVRDADAARGTDLASVDTAQLRMARQHLHQAMGALDMVGQTAAALLLKAMESLVQQFVKDPARCSEASAGLLERASFAVIDYLESEMRGQALSPVGLFPDYRDLLRQTGSDRIHPADLWPHTLRWVHPALADEAPARDYDVAVRQTLDRSLLGIMRSGDVAAARDLQALSLGLARTAGSSRPAVFWSVAAAFFEALQLQVLPIDVYLKRAVPRILLQYTALAGGDESVSERLVLDLLFYCAQVPADAVRPGSTLAGVRRAMGIEHFQPVAYEHRRFGRFDPSMLAQARKRIETVKETWSALSGGDLTRMKNAPGQFGLVVDSLTRLHPPSTRLGQALTQAVDSTVRAGSPPGTELAMEIATVVLYLEAVFDELDPDDPGLTDRTNRLAERLERVMRGNPPEPLESWMEELYRRVSDHQTMGTVVGELRTALTEAEKGLDQFFRRPAERNLLRDVPAQLAQMRGVLSVLGLDQASLAVAQMKDTVEHILGAAPDDVSSPDPALFDRLGNSLGALGFLIDMLNYQPALARKLFVFDSASGELRLLMGRVPADPALTAPPGSAGASSPGDQLSKEVLDVIAEATSASGADATAAAARLDRLATHAALADEAGLAQSVNQVAAALAASDEQAVAGALDRISQATARPVSESPAQPPVEEDDLLDIFLEEAREVIQTGQAAIESLVAEPDDIEQQTTLRRAFHTLKGSSRMVGLSDFGEGAWAMEQVLNAWLSEQKPVSEPLRALAGEALVAFGAWVEDIAAHRPPAWSSEPFRLSADTMRLEQRYRPLGGPATGSADVRSMPATVAAPMAEPVPAPVQMRAPAVSGPGQDWVLVDESPQGSTSNTVWSPDETGAAVPDFEPTAWPEDLALVSDTVAVPDGPLPIEAESVQPPTLDLDIALPALDAVPSPAAPAPAPVSGVEVDLIEIEWPSDLGDDAESARPAPAQTPDADEMFALELAPEASTAEVPDGPAATDEPVAPAPAAVPDAMQVFEDVSVLDLDLEWAPEAPESPAVPVEAEAIAGAADLELPEMPERSEASDALQASEEPAEPPAGPWDAEPAPAAEPFQEPDEQVKVIEGLRIPIPLYNVYLNEADEWSRRLIVELSEWSLETHRPIPEDAIAFAHSLAGSSATVGFRALSDVARALEHALLRLHGQSTGTAEQGVLLCEAAENIRHLLHQFAAGFLKSFDDRVMDGLLALEPHVPDDAPVVPTGAASSAAHLLPVAGLEALQPDQPLVDVLANAASAPAETAAATGAEPAAEAVAAWAAVPAPGATPVAAAPGPAPAAVDASADEWSAPDEDEDIDAVDTPDPDLFFIFEEEAGELLPRLSGALRQWVARPENDSARAEVLRALHTLKGSARLAGALRLGEMAHRMETEIEHLGHEEPPAPAAMEPLVARLDAIGARFERLCRLQNETPALGTFDTAPAPVPAVPVPVAAIEPAPGEADAAVDASQAPADAAASDTGPAPAMAEATPAARPRSEVALPAAAVLAPIRSTGTQAVRVRSQLLDRLMNQAGEVMITRTRLEAELTQLKGSLEDMTGNLDRLRQQLRDIELQAETQMQSRLAQAKDTQQNFDPLEFDRYTRVQELTRMMAESVNDVATVQRNLQRTLEATEDDLVAQARQTRELQRDLLRTRMVEFESISDRLYRVVRQASKDLGKQVRLDITGGSIEMDRGVLERMTPAFEHLLRNCVAHGIEPVARRQAQGKDPTGAITVELSQAGNDVAVAFRDDGAGLDLDGIRRKALEHGLIQPGEIVDERLAAELIFRPGFSTAGEVSELAGRGIGMDVVRSEVQALGGRIETRTQQGQGSSFNLVLPLTTAVTQVVMLRAGDLTVGAPANLVELVRRVSPRDLEQAYNSGTLDYAGQAIPFFWAGALLQSSQRSIEPTARSIPVVIFQSAGQRVAVHFDEVLGNQEVVVKNLGPQLSRLPGLAGMTVLASGAVVLIYNPVAMAAVYGEQARRFSADRAQPEVLGGTAQPEGTAPRSEPAAALVPLVLVVDDSITVRRVTQRLLQREGYRVSLAADGLQALERLQEEVPALVLSDIEMPRMDGFDLVRNIRNDAKLRELPVIMITSRIAAKHREHAQELGVNHYLGKPYAEDELLALVRHYALGEVMPA